MYWITKPYLAESTGNGVQSSIKGKEAFKGGRQIGLLYWHLEDINRDPWVLDAIVGYQILYPSTENLYRFKGR